VFWVISVYFNIRNTLPKFCPFLLGHPIYIFVFYLCIYTREKADLILYLEINISFLIPKRCNEVIQVSEKYITTAYCTGKISLDYKLSNTENHGCVGSTMHYIHDFLGSSRYPETGWFCFSTVCLRFSSKITEQVWLSPSQLIAHHSSHQSMIRTPILSQWQHR